MEENNEFLRILIHEDIYALPDDIPYEEAAPKTEISGTVLLLDYESDDRIEKEEKEVLEKMLAAIKMKKKDVTILYGCEDPATRKQWNSFWFNGAIVLVFSDQIPSYLSAYEIRYTSMKLDHGTIILAHSLVEISGDVDKKRKLWEELKKTYKLN